MKIENTTLGTVADVMDELLVEYERTTMEIDQALVRKVLQAIAVARRVAFMGLLLFVTMPSSAFDTSRNPDQVPSIGLDLWKGQVAGLDRETVETNGGTVGANADFRLPVTNALSLHFFGESEGINNNLKYTDGYRMGLGMRVFIQ